MILLLFTKEVDLEVFAKKVTGDLAGFDAKYNLIWSKKPKYFSFTFLKEKCFIY